MSTNKVMGHPVAGVLSETHDNACITACILCHLPSWGSWAVIWPGKDAMYTETVWCTIKTYVRGFEIKVWFNSLEIFNFNLRVRYVRQVHYDLSLDTPVFHILECWGMSAA